MLTGITLENFKAFKGEQFIPIKPITLVFGPNSAGKSSIIHALAFLKHVDATKGHCDPDTVEFGWEKIKLGSWQNLVHGHDAAAVMKITLHKEEKSLTWEFRKDPDGSPYVHSFEIAENGNPVAKGINQKTKGILWAIELHPDHPFWDLLKEVIWSNMTQITILDAPDPDQDPYEQIGDDFGDLGLTDIQGEIMQVKNFAADRFSNGNILQNMKPFFDRYFSEWLGSSWRQLPSNSFVQSTSMSDLFPRGGTDMENILSFPEKSEISFLSPVTHKDTPKSELRLDQLKNWLHEGSSWCGSTDLPDSEDVFNDIFNEIQWNGQKVLMLDGIKKSFDSHLHVGAFRKLPEETISKRALPVTSATTPWHSLLDNGSELGESERPQNVVNSALKKLDVPYQVATRIRHTIAFMPSNREGESPIPVEDSSFTDEELVFQDSAGVPHPIQSLGSGIGVIVPVVVALSTTDTELLSIEEPESHVHPRLQAELGDIVIVSAKGGRQNAILIETHSEHLILRIQRRIRETFQGRISDWPVSLTKSCPNGLNQDDVAVVWVEPGENGSKVIELTMNADGSFIQNWPRGFFAERLMEMYSINENEL